MAVLLISLFAIVAHDCTEIDCDCVYFQFQPLFPLQILDTGPGVPLLNSRPNNEVRHPDAYNLH